MNLAAAPVRLSAIGSIGVPPMSAVSHPDSSMLEISKKDSRSLRMLLRV
jgi:hypothetical protein